MVAGLDPWSPIGYGLFLRDRLNDLLGRFPELVNILEHPDGLERALDVFCQVAESELNRQASGDELQAFQEQMAPMWSQMKAELAGVQGDGKPPLGDELDVDIETVAREPWRMKRGIPLNALGLGARERRNLEAALGVSLNADDDPQGAEYTQTILPTLLELVVGPDAVERPPLTAKSRGWAWTGTSPPTGEPSVTTEQSLAKAMGAVAGLLKKLGTIEGRQEIVGFILGQQLRHEYGLGRGRGHKSAPFDNDQEIPAGIDGYPEVEAHLDLDAMLKGAPPRQRATIEIYMESDRTVHTVEALARESGVGAVHLPFDTYAAALPATRRGSTLVRSALLASRLLAPVSESRQKRTTYECGMVPIGRVRTQIHVSYYLFAILFLIFDVEAVFLFPWAVTFVDVGQAAFYEMVLFILILGGGLVYAWKKGVLQWK